MSENQITLREEQIGLIEELAHYNEVKGLQPAMSKIVALLTISDEIELTFDQIKETLGLSKSAVSQALNQLILARRITYKTKIGDRKRYFYLRIAEWSEEVQEQFSGVTSLVSIYKKVLLERTETTKEFNENLKDLTNFLDLTIKQLNILIEKLPKHKN